MTKKKIVIIGGGIGGLATANLLAEAGHDVTVYEKNDALGGRAGRLEVEGFTFDTGPSWYLMPDVFEHYYELLGESVDQWLKLKKLTPAYKVFFEGHPTVTITGDIEIDANTFEQIEAGSGAALRRYVKQSNRIYKLSLDHFLYSNFERVTDFLHFDVVKNALWLPRLLVQSIDNYVGRFVATKRLKQILEYPMVFLGTSPFDAPAMYSLMSALDFKEGVFYPQGGMYTIIESMVAMGKKRGVEYRLNSTARRIISSSGKVTGIELEGGEVMMADIVVSNADIQFSETTLLEPHQQSYPEAYWEKKEAGPGALLLYLGVKGKVPEFEHHTLLFVDDWQDNFDSIFKSKTVPEKASIYISKTSHTDPSVAPESDENIFVLVPLPVNVDWDEQTLNDMSEHYLEQIEMMTNVKLRDRLIVKEVFRPGEFETKFNSWRSSMLGQSHLLRQSAFFRTPNKSKKIANLYYVGGSTTPGIGLPMCLIGAELVYKRIIGDKKGGRVVSIDKVGGA